MFQILRFSQKEKKKDGERNFTARTEVDQDHLIRRDPGIFLSPKNAASMILAWRALEDSRKRFNRGIDMIGEGATRRSRI